MRNKNNSGESVVDLAALILQGAKEKKAKKQRKKHRPKNVKKKGKDKRKPKNKDIKRKRKKNVAKKRKFKNRKCAQRANKQKIGPKRARKLKAAKRKRRQHVKRVPMRFKPNRISKRWAILSETDSHSDGSQNTNVVCADSTCMGSNSSDARCTSMFKNEVLCNRCGSSIVGALSGDLLHTRGGINAFPSTQSVVEQFPSCHSINSNEIDSVKDSNVAQCVNFFEGYDMHELIQRYEALLGTNPRRRFIWTIPAVEVECGPERVQNLEEQIRDAYNVENDFEVINEEENVHRGISRPASPLVDAEVVNLPNMSNNVDYEDVVLGNEHHNDNWMHFGNNMYVDPDSVVTNSNRPNCSSENVTFQRQESRSEPTDEVSASSELSAGDNEEREERGMKRDD